MTTPDGSYRYADHAETRPDVSGGFYNSSQRRRLSAEAEQVARAGDAADELARRVNNTGRQLVVELDRLTAVIATIRRRFADGQGVSGGVELARYGADVDRLADRIDADRAILALLLRADADRPVTVSGPETATVRGERYLDNATVSRVAEDRRIRPGDPDWRA